VVRLSLSPLLPRCLPISLSEIHGANMLYMKYYYHRDQELMPRRAEGDDQCKPWPGDMVMLFPPLAAIAVVILLCLLHL
jgi:hypothetical protein